MQQRVLKLFDLVCIVNEYVDGETYTTKLTNPKNTLYCASGTHEFVLEDQSFAASYSGPSVFKLSQYQNGLYNCTVKGNSTIYCFDPNLNQNRTFNLQLVNIKAGTEISVDSNKNLFLYNGQVLVNGNVIDAPAKLSFKNTTNLKAVVDVSGIFVE